MSKSQNYLKKKKIIIIYQGFSLSLGKNEEEGDRTGEGASAASTGGIRNS